MKVGVFLDFASKNQLPGLSVNGTLVENGLRDSCSNHAYKALKSEMNNVKWITLNFLYHSESVPQFSLLSPYSPSLLSSSSSSESTCGCGCKTPAVAGTAYRIGRHFPLMCFQPRPVGDGWRFRL